MFLLTIWGVDRRGTRRNHFSLPVGVFQLCNPTTTFTRYLAFPPTPATISVYSGASRISASRPRRLRVYQAIRNALCHCVVKEEERNHITSSQVDYPHFINPPFCPSHLVSLDPWFCRRLEGHVDVLISCAMPFMNARYMGVLFYAFYALLCLGWESKITGFWAKRAQLKPACPRLGYGMMLQLG